MNAGNSNSVQLLLLLLFNTNRETIQTNGPICGIPQIGKGGDREK